MAIDASLAAGAIGYSLLLHFLLIPLQIAAYPDFSDELPTGADMAVITVAEVAAALALLVRRRHPLPVAAVCTAVIWLGGPASTFPFGLYTLVVQRRNRWAVAYALAAAAIPIRALWSTTAVWGGGGPAEPLPLYLEGFLLGYVNPTIVVPVLVGITIRKHRVLISTLDDQAKQLQREQALISRNARLEERTRIAGDMHDVVTHYLGLMILRAGAMEAQAGRESETGKSARLVGDLGRRAMKELRDLLGVLRSDPEADGEPSAGDDPGAGESRSGTWGAQVVKMLNAAHLAGVPLTWQVDGEPEEADAAVLRAAYRVVQEALSNASRHAPGAEVRVAVETADQRLEISVHNGPSPFPAIESERDGGRGLTGMRERVAQVGGTLWTFDTPDGGFDVCASFPLGAPVPAAPHDQDPGRGRRGAGPAEHPAGTGSR
ncbi:sensor histidine kinase [Wenjunlia tyrosinilytica]|uniref:sensor histidine kinase n=1 Tax=Wenjunlia tyrosinilytica TaxID=1544741 RepID=UPI001669914C|nr:histidine kinase [Wenjunlia tyrosinilytica]